MLMMNINDEHDHNEADNDNKFNDGTDYYNGC